MHNVLCTFVVICKSSILSTCTIVEHFCLKKHAFDLGILGTLIFIYNRVNLVVPLTFDNYIGGKINPSTKF